MHQIQQYQHYFWLSLPAAVVLVALVELIAYVAVQFRARRFQAEDLGDKAADRGGAAANYRIPQVAPADTRCFRRLDDLALPLGQLHERANRLQALYHRRVARFIACLALALVLLGLTFTVSHGCLWFEVVAAVCEVLLLALALAHWWMARMANLQWVVARSKVELVRQWTFLYAFLQQGESDAPGRAQKLFQASAAEIDAAFAKLRPAGWWQWVAHAWSPADRSHLIDTLVREVEDCWARTRARHAGAPMPDRIAAADLHLYLRRRPVRQLAWFGVARRRLKRSGWLRELGMATLFTLSIALAIAKLGLLVWHLGVSAKPEGAASFCKAPLSLPTLISIAAMLLLSATAVSAALTGIYLSRNDRSLRHRYAQQEQHIKEWIGKVWQTPEGVAPAGSAQPPKGVAFRDRILEFEDLMVAELIDWIHISAHDVLELGG